VSAPPAHFSEAQAEQALWQELRNHSASLNNTLNETLRIHADLAWRVFQVRIFPMGFGVFLPPLLFLFLRAYASSNSASPLYCFLETGARGPSSGEARPPRPIELRA
jgi:hypothetical protein